MPTVNIFFEENNDIRKLDAIAPQLREYLADKLSCNLKKLTPPEISIRFIKTDGGEMIASIELEITAHAFPERVERQDKICLEVVDYIKKQIPTIKELQVWLKLCELGHSWKS
ncbi:MAG: hypothetical protein KJ592_02375 [Nanoarchaeota archaeon]|nr:hypothetical protein [Nanoarchaeota archaeon]